MERRHYRWEDLPGDQPLEKLMRRRVVGERVMVARIALDAGCHVPSHAHENEQIAVVLQGRIQFDLGPAEDPESESVVVGAGEVLHLPPWQPHGARALEDSVVLDVFSPPSEATGIDQVGR